jgi:hypothetical protein
MSCLRTNHSSASTLAQIPWRLALEESGTSLVLPIGASFFLIGRQFGFGPWGHFPTIALIKQ